MLAAFRAGKYPKATPTPAGKRPCGVGLAVTHAVGNAPERGFHEFPVTHPKRELRANRQ